MLYNVNMSVSHICLVEQKLHSLGCWVVWQSLANSLYWHICSWQFG